MTNYEILIEIVTRLLEDNGLDYEFSASGALSLLTDSELARAGDAVGTLVASGYFEEHELENLDGSFWQAAAGEEAERDEFFNRAPGAWHELNRHLEHLFEIIC